MPGAAPITGIDSAVIAGMIMRRSVWNVLAGGALVWVSIVLAQSTPSCSRALASQDEGKLRFRPRDVPPMNPSVAAAADGRWFAVPDPIRADAEPLLFATELHPDAKRPRARVRVVAAPLSQVYLYAVAGSSEPEATTVTGKRYVRPGIIPPEQHPLLLAAFNGGATTTAGQPGMYVGGFTLVPPKPALCTLLGLHDGALRLGTWRGLASEAERAERESRLLFWRQGPPCLYEDGELNRALPGERAGESSATASDATLLARRSAVGLDRARSVLFVGFGTDITARAMAEAMHRAGAGNVIQLDLDAPKFLLFPFGPDGNRRATGLFEGFAFTADDYVVRPSERDFFFLVRREPAHHR